MSNNYTIINHYGKGISNIKGEFLFLDEDPNLCVSKENIQNIDPDVFEGPPVIPNYSPSPEPSIPPSPLPTVTPTPPPTPTPTPSPIYGCMDPDALNYNPNATIDDGSCIYNPNEFCCGLGPAVWVPGNPYGCPTYIHSGIGHTYGGCCTNHENGQAHADCTDLWVGYG